MVLGTVIKVEKLDMREWSGFGGPRGSAGEACESRPTSRRPGLRASVACSSAVERESYRWSAPAMKASPSSITRFATLAATYSGAN